MHCSRLIPLFLFLLQCLNAQQTGAVRGTVTLESSGDPLHHATVTVSRTGRVGETGEDGKYEISGIPPGTYSIHAHLQSLSDEVRTVTKAVVEAARRIVPVSQVHFRRLLVKLYQHPVPLMQHVTVQEAAMDQVLYRTTLRFLMPGSL